MDDWRGLSELVLTAISTSAEAANTSFDLTDTVSALSLKSVYWASTAIVLLVLVAIFFPRPSNNFKRLLFWSLTSLIIVTTTFLATSTLYINSLAIGRGPVHWHTDFQIWACGQRIDLRNPTGLSNKIGTPILHEHNDERIHVEGPVLHREQISLGNFFKVIGGELAADKLTVPLTPTPTLSTWKNGDDCGGKEGELQVFAFQVANNVYRQTKLTDPANYIMAYEGAVPPGDCIIIEFDQPKDRTDHLCQSYMVAKETKGLNEY